VSLERETKLQVDAGFRLPELAWDGFAATEGATRRFATTYVDTPDLRIARWGASLRHREGEGWMVKLPLAGAGSSELLARDERRFEGADPRRVPNEAADLLRAYARGRGLEPVARLRTVRRPVEIVDELGRRVAVVTDDEVSVMQGRRVAARFREVEVELEEGVPAETGEELVRRLQQAGAGEVENVPKLRRALGPAAEAPADVMAPAIGKDSSVEDVVRAALSASVIRLVRNDPGVRLGEDPEAVHQARVATRRLRSELRTFRDVLEPAWGAEIRGELRRLGEELGAVRDPEVLRDRLRARASRLAPRDREAVDSMVRRLEAQRDEARRRLVEDLGSQRYASLLDAVVEASGTPRVLEGVAAARAVDALPAILEAPWKNLVSAVERVEEDESDDTLHRARIRAKRIRYAADAAAPVFGKAAKAFAKAAAGLQDVLGEHQDAVVARAWLRETADADPSYAFVAGQLDSLEAAAASEARAAWPDAWKALARKRLRFWA